MSSRTLRLIAVALIFLMGTPVPTLAQAPPPNYILGPGDTVSVTIEGNDELTRSVAIGVDGKIVLPLIGTVQAAGLTLQQLQARLTEMYRRYLKNPRVAVSLFQLHQIKVGVVGEVAAPGIKDLVVGSTVLDALSKANGVTDKGAIEQAYLIRGGRQVLTLDLPQVLKGNEKANIVLEDGDVIIVPETANILVVGDGIRTPGSYAPPRGATVLSMLLLAGGVTERVSLKEARLLRGRTQVPIDLEAVLLKLNLSQDVSVQGGDIIVVPEDVSKELQVFVLGYVVNPGAFQFRTTRTALQALAAAGGAASGASLKDAYIVRRIGSGTTGGTTGQGRIKIDLAAALLRGDVSRDVPLQPGDVLVVPQQTIFSFGTYLAVVLGILTGVRFVR